MRKVKRLLAVMLVVMISFGLAGCRVNKEADNKNYKFNIVTTLFPYYDFARAVIGDVDGINLQMTVAPGQDSHSFEPTPKDIVNINEADLFIYNGGLLETWVDTVLDSLDNKKKARLRMMDYVDVLDEEHVEGMDTRFEEEHGEEDQEAVKESVQEDIHEEHEQDEHIWTSPVNAQILIRKICDQMCRIDPQHATQFKANTEAYINKLKNIDSKIRDTVSKSKVKEIIFADKFPLQYFAKEYGLKYYAAFPGCGSDMEPSVKTIVFLINQIKKDNIKAVFYLELSSHSTADTICEDTGAKALEFNSCHNITDRQFRDGVTYVDFMENNASNLKQALGE